MSIVTLAGGMPAGAAPDGVQEKKAEIQAAQERLQEIQTKASVSYETYNSALLGLNDLDEKIDGSKKDLTQAEERVAEAQKNLEDAAAQVYKSGNVGFIDVLVGSEDFSEFASRLKLWVRLLGEERDRFEVVLEARNDLKADQAKLEEQRDRRVATLKSAVKEKEQAEDAASEAEDYLQSLSGDLRAEIQAAAAQRAADAQAAAEAAVEKAAVEKTGPAPAPEMAQVAQVAPQASQSDLRAERKAAEQRAAERADKRAAADAAAKKAERQAELAAKEAAEKKSAKREAAQKRAEEQRAQAEAARQAAKEAAIEQAAAERAAERAAQRETAKKAAEEQAAAEQAAAEQQAAEQAAADQAAAEQAAAEQTTPEATTPETTAPESTVPEATTPAPEPAPSTGGGSCGDTFGGVQPYVAEVGCAVRAQFGLETIYGYRAGDPGDHGTGRALDFMVYSDSALGDQVAEYLLANQSEFGISYIIWQQRINFGSGWQPMEDRGSITANHYDHVHASFY
ncbi:MAG TPA: hypothetical protein VFJ72_14300 [Rubrobacteraceae bacterium]|nr:hypothetical protein [Rubrobacteraceae bacterium]